MDIFLANVQHLMGKRAPNQVGNESGVGQSWMSRLLTGKSAARTPERVKKLADYFGVSAAALQYTDLTGARIDPASQLLTPEEQTLGAAVKLLRFYDDLQPSPAPPETYASRLYVALQVVNEEGAASVVDGAGLVEASRKLAARLRAA